MKTPDPSFTDYLNSPFFVEVAVVLVFGIALLPTLFVARRIGWPQQSPARQAAVVFGWSVLVLSTLWWAGMLYLTVEAVRSDVETYFPKKTGIFVPLLGGLVYFVLIAISHALFSLGRSPRNSPSRKQVHRGQRF